VSAKRPLFTISDRDMVCRSIIKRAGSVPMSIAGIAKEVSTISISAWVFGDQLTELNIVGVVITVCGKSFRLPHGDSFDESTFRDRAIHLPQVSEKHLLPRPTRLIRNR